MKYDLAVVIGRFQPVHNGHIALINEAKKIADEVLILVGSSFQAQTYKNPFTFNQRMGMLYSTQNPHDCLIHVEPLRDEPYNEELWIQNVQAKVSKLEKKTICLVGHKKDKSSYYLEKFPQWDYKEVSEYEPLSATSVRELLFRERPNMNFLSGVVPNPVFNWLIDYSNKEEMMDIYRERKFTENYRKQFEHLKYPPVFVTADAVVFCAGHVLMIRRRAYPGKGLLALPGGFLDTRNDASMLQASLRELRQETRIDAPERVLRANVRESKVFDAIDRSSRGRTITHAFNIQLDDNTLPKVKAGSDAKEAIWVPFAELKEEECFEDHYHIFKYFI